MTDQDAYTRECIERAVKAEEMVARLKGALRSCALLALTGGERADIVVMAQGALDATADPALGDDE